MTSCEVDDNLLKCKFSEIKDGLDGEGLFTYVPNGLNATIDEGAIKDVAGNENNGTYNSTPEDKMSPVILKVCEREEYENKTSSEPCGGNVTTECVAVKYLDVYLSENVTGNVDNGTSPDKYFGLSKGYWGGALITDNGTVNATCDSNSSCSVCSQSCYNGNFTKVEIKLSDDTVLNLEKTKIYVRAGAIKDSNNNTLEEDSPLVSMLSEKEEFKVKSAEIKNPEEMVLTFSGEVKDGSVNSTLPVIVKCADDTADMIENYNVTVSGNQVTLILTDGSLKDLCGSLDSIKGVVVVENWLESTAGVGVCSSTASVNNTYEPLVPSSAYFYSNDTHTLYITFKGTGSVKEFDDTSAITACDMTLPVNSYEIMDENKTVKLTVDADLSKFCSGYAVLTVSLPEGIAKDEWGEPSKAGSVKVNYKGYNPAISKVKVDVTVTENGDPKAEQDVTLILLYKRLSGATIEFGGKTYNIKITSAANNVIYQAVQSGVKSTLYLKFKYVTDNANHVVPCCLDATPDVTGFADVNPVAVTFDPATFKLSTSSSSYGDVDGVVNYKLDFGSVYGCKTTENGTCSLDLYVSKDAGMVAYIAVAVGAKDNFKVAYWVRYKPYQVKYDVNVDLGLFHEFVLQPGWNLIPVPVKANYYIDGIAKPESVDGAVDEIYNNLDELMGRIFRKLGMDGSVSLYGFYGNELSYVFNYGKWYASNPGLFGGYGYFVENNWNYPYTIYFYGESLTDNDTLTISENGWYILYNWKNRTVSDILNLGASMVFAYDSSTGEYHYCVGADLCYPDGFKDEAPEVVIVDFEDISGSVNW